MKGEIKFDKFEVIDAEKAMVMKQEQPTFDNDFQQFFIQPRSLPVGLYELKLTMILLKSELQNKESIFQKSVFIEISRSKINAIMSGGLRRTIGN